MTQQISNIPELGFQLGDHVCAFYNGGSELLNDIVADFVSKGLRAGNKCAFFCFIQVARDRSQVNS